LYIGGIEEDVLPFADSISVPRKLTDRHCEGWMRVMLLREIAWDKKKAALFFNNAALSLVSGPDSNNGL
jgi:hypothetical protein